MRRYGRWSTVAARLAALVVLSCVASWMMLRWRPGSEYAYAEMMVARENSMLRQWGWDLTIRKMEELLAEDVMNVLETSNVPVQPMQLDALEALLQAESHSQTRPTLALFYLDVGPTSESPYDELVRTRYKNSDAPNYVCRVNAGFALSCRQALRTCRRDAVRRLLVIPVRPTTDQAQRKNIEKQLDQLGVQELPCLLAYMPADGKSGSIPSPALLAQPQDSTYRTIFHNADKIVSEIRKLAGNRGTSEERR